MPQTPINQDKYEELKAEYGDIPELINEMMNSQSFQVPTGATFWDLYESRFEADKLGDENLPDTVITVESESKQEPAC